MTLVITYVRKRFKHTPKYVPIGLYKCTLPTYKSVCHPTDNVCHIFGLVETCPSYIPFDISILLFDVRLFDV